MLLVLFIDRHQEGVVAPALDDEVEDAAVSYLSFVGDVKLGGHAPVQEGPMDLRPNRLGQIFVDAIVLGTRRVDGRIICGRAIGTQGV